MLPRVRLDNPTCHARLGELSDPRAIISCRKRHAKSNNLIHKGLAFLRNWSATVVC
jgi:hypothetical protein